MGIRSLGGNRKPDASTSGTEIEHHRISDIAKLLKRQLNKQFRLGSRDEHALADLKRSAEEVPFAEDILKRFAGYTAQNRALNKFGLLIGNIIVAEHYLSARKPGDILNKTGCVK